MALLKSSMLLAMASLASAPCAATAAAAGTVAPGASTLDASVDRPVAASALVIARTRPDGYLTQPARCQSLEVLCMDPPPFRLDVEVIEVVAGELPARRISVVSSGHMGMAWLDRPRTVLMRVVADETAYIAPRYQISEVRGSRAGKLRLKDGRDAPRWLPCAVRGDLDAAQGAAVDARQWRQLLAAAGEDAHSECPDVDTGSAHTSPVHTSPAAG